MHAAAIRVEARVPDTHSLKEKRHKVKSVMRAVATKFPVSVSEIDYQDLWQRTSIGIAVVAPQAGQVDRILHSVEKILREHDHLDVIGVERSYLEGEA